MPDSFEIEIPASLYRRIEERIKDTEFQSVRDYVVYVLREVLSEDEPEDEELSDEDVEKIKKRLKSLGYLE
jgi:Arc/MetJ-type ribon-helix-helix transcriptional regulator